MPLLTPLHDNSPPSRPNSIFGQRFMMTSIPAASAVFAASSLRTPSCIHTTLAPIAIASATIAGRLRRRAEHVDHVDLSGMSRERRVDGFAEQGLAGDGRIDRDHAIAFALQVLHHEVARPVPVRRGADHGDRPHPLEDRADLRVGIGNRFEVGHGQRAPVREKRAHPNAKERVRSYPDRAPQGRGSGMRLSSGKPAAAQPSAPSGYHATSE